MGDELFRWRGEADRGQRHDQPRSPGRQSRVVRAHRGRSRQDVCVDRGPGRRPRSSAPSGPSNPRARGRDPVSRTALRPRRHGTDVWAISTPLTQVEKGVFRIDTSTNELVETIELPNPRAIAADEAVWVGDAVTGSLFRIDPATSAVEETTEFPIAPTQVAVGEGSVWLGFTDGTVARVDPLTGDELATIDVGRFVTGIAVDEGSVWAAVANETAIP